MILKHYLDVYKNLPGFPQANDLYFEIKEHLKKKQFSFSDMKTCLTFKINRKDFDVLVETLINKNLINRIDKDKYEIV